MLLPPLPPACLFKHLREDPKTRIDLIVATGSNQHERVIESLVRLLSGVASNQKLLLIVEDLVLPWIIGGLAREASLR